jgi:hypothetical protein
MTTPRLQCAPRTQILIGLSLALLLAATRSHHFMSFNHLPDASWAVLFLAGAYVRPRWVFAGLAALAVAVDWVAINLGGVSSFCVTPAYALLLPAYGALWLGGRWYANHHRNALATLPPLAAATLVSAFAAELLSSGGFYFLGGYYPDASLAGFLPRLVAYFPGTLGAMSLYVGLAAVLHATRVTRRTGDAEGPRTLQPGAPR